MDGYGEGGVCVGDGPEESGKERRSKTGSTRKRRRKDKPFVVIPKSPKKLSVNAWPIFARSSSSAINMMHAHTMMRQSILRISRCSSPHVQRARGSKRWMFSLYSRPSVSDHSSSRHKRKGRRRRMRRKLTNPAEADTSPPYQGHQTPTPVWRWRRDRRTGHVGTRSDVLRLLRLVEGLKKGIPRTWRRCWTWSLWTRKTRE